MSGIPLPALDAHAPQTDPAEQIGKMVQMKSMLQSQQMQQGQLQLQQQQIKDQQAMTAAMKNWDGKDYDSLSKSVLQNGGSANAATQIQQHGLTIKKTVSDIAKNDSETGAKNLETFIGKQKAIGDALQGIEDVPDEQLHSTATQKVQSLMQGGLLDPQTGQKALQGIQTIQDPKALRQQIDVFAKASMGAKAAAEQEKTRAETKKDTAQAGEAQSVSLKNKAEMDFYARNPGAGAPGVPAESVSLMDYMRTVPGASPSKYPAWKAKQTSEAEAPVRIATAEAEGRARANIEAQTARGSNAALAQVPPHLVGQASTAATKVGEDYAQAQSVTQRLNAMMDAARKGNVVAYQVMPEEGTLQITTSQGVHRINKTEIDQYAGGGSLWQRLLGHVGKTLTGESIPKSVLDDMAEIQKIQAEGSQLKYNNSLKTINQNYGANFKPVEMAELPRNEQAAKPSGPPANATHIGVGSLDKKKHYLDANGKDLGPAE